MSILTLLFIMTLGIINIYIIYHNSYIRLFWVVFYEKSSEINPMGCFGLFNRIDFHVVEDVCAEIDRITDRMCYEKHIIGIPRT